jgi:hypothetical protein
MEQFLTHWSESLQLRQVIRPYAESRTVDYLHVKKREYLVPICCEHSVNVKASPEGAFALLDDLSQTPKWLGPCTAIEKLSPGPNEVGDKLRYSYKQGGRAGTMDGEILTRTPNRKLIVRYFDMMMEVLIDFDVCPTSSGSRLTHVITITPRSFMAKLMSPFIRLALPKQTRQAMEKLKGMLDAK